MAITFDGEALIITLESGVTELDWMDVYSAWKDWMLASPMNRRYPEAFRTAGGDPLTATIDSGRYFFLRNDYGWRIKPPEEDITIYATGNLAPEDSTLPIFIPTTGGYTAAILGLQAVTQGVSTDAIAAAVWTDSMLLKVVMNKKTLEKSGTVWHLIVYDDDDVTPILDKELKDSNGNNISDLAVGALAQELASSV